MKHMYPKSKRIKLGAFCLIIGSMLLASSGNARTAAAVAAQTQAAIDAGAPPAWMNPTLPGEIQQNVENKGEGLAKALDLDKAKTATVAALMTGHYARVWAWHQQVDEQLDAAWAAWNDARDNTNGQEKDELKALTVMTEEIDPIYAEFEPQIQGVLKALRGEIGEEKTIELLDRITRSPGAERTYNAYCAMIPEMTDAEKAIIWKRMEQAREDSLAAWTGGRIVSIFKKYKIRNEFSIDYFGYGYRERYKAWASGG